MKNLSITSLLVLLGTSVCMLSCVQMKYNSAEYLYKNKEYAPAAKKYEKVDKFNNPAYDVSEHKGDSYQKLHDYENAEKAYAEAIVKHPKQSDLYYQMALVMKMSGKCAEGKSYLQQFLKLEREKNNDVFFSDDFCSETSKMFELYQSQKIELSKGKTFFNPISYDGRLYFLTQLDGENQYDICSVNELDKSDFNELNGNVNSIYSEGPFDFDRTTNELYFTRQKVHLDELVANKNFVVQLEIMKAKFDGKKWNIEAPFSYNEAEYSVGHPSISEDGKHMVFVSNKPGSIGQTDLYITHRLTDGSWGKPSVLPEPFNSSYKEVTPGIRKNLDNTGYLLSFSSDRPSSQGGLDVYAVEFDGKNWGELIHYDFPVNSSFNEFSLKYNYDNNTSIVVSDRDREHSADEVFQFAVSNRVEGTLKDKMGLAISSEQLRITHTKSGKKQSTMTNGQGKYQVDLEQGAEYKIETVSDKFEPMLVTVTSDKKMTPVIYELDLIIKRLDEKKDVDQITVNQLYFELNKSTIAEQQSTDLIKLLNTLNKYKDVAITIIGHTDSRGSAAYNQKLSQLRAESVVDWLINKGVERNRLSYQGRGESELVNNCSNGVSCTEEQHQMNRRTTFLVSQIVLVNN